MQRLRKLLIHTGRSKELPLQEAQLGVCGGFFDAQCGQLFGLPGVDGGDAGNGGGGVDADCDASAHAVEFPIRFVPLLSFLGLDDVCTNGAQ